MSGTPVKWNQIEITNKKTDELKDLEINLEEDLEQEEEEEKSGSKQSPDRDAGGKVQASKEDKDSEARTQERKSEKENVKERSQVKNEEDEGEIQPEGQSRRARRIRFLNSRVQELESQLTQERNGRVQAQTHAQKVQANNVTSQKKLYERMVEDKTTEYEKAVESNDAKAQAKALRELNDAQIKFQVYSAAESELPDDDQEQEHQQQVQQQNQRPQQQQAPQAAVRWVEKNPWFLSNKAAHMATRAINEDLHREGFDPNSDDFYDELNTRLEDEGLNLKKLRGDKEEVKSQQKQQRRSPVGSSGDDSDVLGSKPTRTQFKREGNKVLVTPTEEDREFAETMGIPIENHMQNKLIYEETGGKGYTPVIIRPKR